MFRKYFALLLVALALGSCSTSRFSITEQNIDAVKPRTVTLVTLNATNSGANLVAFAYSNLSIVNFLRQLEHAGAANVQLLNMSHVNVCGRQVNRAEFKIDGDTSRFVSPALNGEENIRLVSQDGKEFQCNRKNILPEDPNKYENIVAYSKTVTDKISRQPFTKEELELRDVGGEGTFSIGILADGNLQSIEVANSTGSKSADEEIIKRIKSASPFSPPPAAAIGASGVFHIYKPFFYPKPK
ncbi:MAG: energy transducer TonB [Sideroxyarcus sp.]